MINYCPNCGNQVNDGGTFCPNCGTALNQQTAIDSNVQNNTINNNAAPTVDKNQNLNTQLNQDVNQPISEASQMYNAQMNNVQNQNATKNDNTVTAFVLSLLGFLCCTYLAIPGLIMSIMSLQNMNSGLISKKNKGLAIAGIILGAIGIIIMINNIINPNPEVTNMINEITGE